MFDLDQIENDWLDNSFRLSEEEIIEIYRKENATLTDYNKQWEDFRIHTHVNMTVEERLLKAIYGELKDVQAEEEKLTEKYIEENGKPTPKHLSQESQKKVVEGSLWIVFDETRFWYKYLNEKLQQEEIYYVCLEALIKSVKYMCHCEKKVFKYYVHKSINQRTIEYISKFCFMDYRETKEIVDRRPCLEEDPTWMQILLECNRYQNKEEVEKPSILFSKIIDNVDYVDYVEDISSLEFMRDYYQALNKLNDLDKKVMQMSYDTNGYPGLTCREISDYLGISIKEVENIRKRAKRLLRQDMNLKSYLNN